MKLELCGLVINITSFSHQLKKIDFNAIVYHLALKPIIESKAEPATNRTKRLLEVLSSYSFNLHYIKGKEMILTDFSVWVKHDTHDMIHMRSSLCSSVCKKYYMISLFYIKLNRKNILFKLDNKLRLMIWSCPKYMV